MAEPATILVKERLWQRALQCALQRGCRINVLACPRKADDLD
ncbi:hypothetical protein [Geodermatophilus sp. FMUSA9-8]